MALFSSRVTPGSARFYKIEPLGITETGFYRLDALPTTQPTVPKQNGIILQCHFLPRPSLFGTCPELHFP